MTTINVSQKTQTIVVDAATRSISIINAGPIGPAGPTGEVSLAQFNAALALKVAKAGDTMTGALTIPVTPTAVGHATSKQYVDNAIAEVIAAAPGGGGGGGGMTNLTTIVTADAVVIVSDTGTDAVISAANGTEAGLMLPAQVARLSALGVGTISLASFDPDPTGASDSSPAFAAAIAAASQKEEILIGPGTYRVDTPIFLPGPRHLVGVGRPTIVVGGANNLFLNAAAADMAGLVVRGLTIDLASTSHDFPLAVYMNESGVNSGSVLFDDLEIISNKYASLSVANQRFVTVQRCRFRSPNGKHPMYGVYAAGAQDCDFVDNIFESQGTALSFAVSVDLASDPPTRNNRIDGNRINGHWMTGPWAISGSGGTVSYTPTSVVDSAANFTALSASPGVGGKFTTLRALDVKLTTTISVIYPGAVTLTDSSVGVLHGYLLRTADAQCKIDRALSGNKYAVSAWTSTHPSDFGTPVQLPAVGTAVTMYAPIFGRVDSFTPTTITTLAWVSLTGAPTTPPAGCRYEIVGLSDIGLFGIQVATGSERFRIVNNHIEETWVEAIYACGSDHVISNNEMVDGQDMGITISTSGAVGSFEIGNCSVTGNKVFHHAAAGIALESPGNVATGNQIEACGWRLDLSAIAGRPFQCGVVINKSDNVVSGLNVIAGMSAVCRAAVAIDGLAGGNVVRAVKTLGTTGGQYYITSILPNDLEFALPSDTMVAIGATPLAIHTANSAAVTGTASKVSATDMIGGTDAIVLSLPGLYDSLSLGSADTKYPGIPMVFEFDIRAGATDPLSMLSVEILEWDEVSQYRLVRDLVPLSAWARVRFKFTADKVVSPWMAIGLSKHPGATGSNVEIGRLSLRYDG